MGCHATMSFEEMPHARTISVDSRKRTMDPRSCLELPATTQIIKCGERDP